MSGNDESLLFMKVFHGRKPDYLPWIEIYGISPAIRTGKRTLRYYGSPLEEKLLGMVAGCLEGGETLFVEYGNDVETRNQLQAGFPPVLSRLGYMMLGMGFTWFKDWYYPEGFMEGGMKLQGEKPGNREAVQRSAERIREEALGFLRQQSRTLGKNYIWNSIKRAEKIAGKAKRKGK